MRLGRNFRQRGPRKQRPSLLTLASAILRSFGTNASQYPFATLQGAYQTSAGPAATAVGDPIGLELDAMGTVESELVTNGDFSAGATGWTLPAQFLVTGGALVGVGLVAFSTISALTSVGAQIGKVFRVTANISNLVSNEVNFVFGGNAVMAATNGFFVGYIFCGAADPTLYIQPTHNGGSFTLDNISVKEVTGNHAAQTTAINRPTLQRGLWNGVSYSDDLGNAAWNDFRSTTWVPNGIVGPRGTLAGKLTEVAATGTHFIQRATSVPLVVGAVQTMAFAIASGGRDFFMGMCDAAGGNMGSPCRFSLVDGATTIKGSGVASTSSAPMGGGFWLFTITATPTGATAFPSIGTALDRTTTPGSYPVYLGDITKGLYVAGVGLFQGTLTADQILAQGGIPLTTSSAGSNPTAGNYWARFNGTNSKLDSAPAFQLADDSCVVVCFVISELGGFQVIDCPAYNAAGSGSLSTLLVDPSGHPYSYWRDDAGVGTGDPSGAVLSVGVPYVMTCWKVGTTAVTRINSVQVSSVTTPGGSITVNSGRTGHASVGFHFNGGNYGVQRIKGTLTLAQVITIEKAAGKAAGLLL